MNLDKALDELNRAPDLATPNLPALAYLLRHPEMWPVNFGPWNWIGRGTCARGLAVQFWPQQVLHLHDTVVNHLFYSHDNNHMPQPTDVADRIDRYLEKVRS